MPYAWRRRRCGLPRGLLRTDSPSARSRTTTVRPKKRACVEKTTPPKIERASPVVFCSSLRCEARFSIGRIARNLHHETSLQRGLRTGKTRAQNPAPWILACFCKASCVVQARSSVFYLAQKWNEASQTHKKSACTCDTTAITPPTPSATLLKSSGPRSAVCQAVRRACRSRASRE